MIYRNINLFIFARIDKKILENLVDVIKEENLYFSNIAIVTGNFGEKLIEKNKISKQFSKTRVYNFYKISNLSDLRSLVVNQRAELILAIGGGSVIDLGKYISMETSIPLISIPTLLSNDGIASPISIIKSNRGYRSLGTTPPIGVIADIDVISHAPGIFLLSGIGDLISNLSAALDWELAHKEIGEKIDVLAKNIAYNSAINILYAFKTKSYESLRDENLLKDLFYGLIMSAISMIIAKSSRPASGSEHNISHALDKICSNQLHGIQVGFATIFTLYLHKKINLLEDILMVYKNINFPLNFNALKISEEKFIKALKLAPNIRERFTVLNTFQSVEILEKMFKEFKKKYLST